MTKTLPYPSTKGIAAITGATGGLGRFLVQDFAADGWYVLALHRKAQGAFGQERVMEMAVDLTQDDQLSAICETLRDIRCDVLINAAGWLADGSDVDGHLMTQAEVRQSFAVNLFAPMMLSQAVLPGMKSKGSGRIVNVSSGAATYGYQGRGRHSYRSAKAALNYMTKCLADECKGTNVLVNAACPGWMNTDMGGAGGRDPILAVPGIKWLATLPRDGPTGELFRDRQPLDW